MKAGKRRTLNAELPTPNQTSADGYLEFHDGSPGGRRFNLEDRLLAFASAVIDLSEKLPVSRAGNHIAGQILRSGTSPLPNHGEAEAAESRADFIHKLRICLKELRETRRWASLIAHRAWCANDATLLFVLSEADELIRIFNRSVLTAVANSPRPKPTNDSP